MLLDSQKEIELSGSNSEKRRASRRGSQSVCRMGTAAIALVLFFASACHIRLVSEFDTKTLDDTLSCAKMVDRFYADLLEADQGHRPYSAYVKQYIEVETELAALVLRNQVRSRNENSVKIAEEIRGLWLEVKEEHRKADGYGTGAAKLDRGRFARMFANAARFERAKKD